VASADLPNDAIADALQELGDLYELDGAAIHRVAAYRTAAQSVREAAVSVAALARAGRATELPGIGATLEGKILTLLDTGTIPSAERLRERYPPGLIAVTRVPGLGPKRARQLHEALGIDSLESLREAAAAGRLRTVRGVGAKLEERVLGALDAGVAERPPARVLIHRAVQIGESLVAALREHGPADARIELAGSTRRAVDAVRDIDIAASTREPGALAAGLGAIEEIANVGATGAGGARGRTHTGLDVELRIGAPAEHGNLLQHLTGSAAHNAALRERAVRAGLSVSEHGIARTGGGAPRMCAEEREVYAALGLDYIPPELREDRGEIAAAAERGRGLPQLVEQRDIRGDLHCHTVASDGRATIEEMALAARALDYEYLAITDHSASHGFGNAVSPDELRRQIERVREAGDRLEGIELLVGSEVNVLPDGSLDYEDELLAQLDWVLASVHTAFGISEQAMTERMIAAIEHPLVDAIGHPTGRLIERREPYALDVGAVIAAAAATGTMLEINANPRRRDLSDLHARAAARAGVLLVIDSDAHGPETLELMRWGVATARRAWLTPRDVANTRPWAELRRLCKHGRRDLAGTDGLGAGPGRHTPAGR
jgi:DNA polymerase (family 10)